MRDLNIGLLILGCEMGCAGSSGTAPNLHCALDAEPTVLMLSPTSELVGSLTVYRRSYVSCICNVFQAPGLAVTYGNVSRAHSDIRMAILPRWSVACDSRHLHGSGTQESSRFVPLHGLAMMSLPDMTGCNTNMGSTTRSIVAAVVNLASTSGADAFNDSDLSSD